MWPYIPPGITAAARRRRSESSARTFSWLAVSVMVWLPFCSDELARDRLDAGGVEAIAVIEGGGGADHDVLVRHAVAPEGDARARLGEDLGHGGAEAAGEVVLLHREQRRCLAGGGEDRVAVKGIDRVHVDDPGLDPA